MNAVPVDIAAVVPGAVSVDRRPSPVHSTHPLEEIDVELGGGRRLELLLKYGGEFVAETRAAKGADFATSQREVEAYLLLGRYVPGPPRLHAHGETWVLLERVTGSPLDEVGELTTWQRTASWLGRLHAAFRAHRPAAGLPELDASWYRATADRARAASGSIARVADGYGRVVETLSALPKTLVHGEFYPSNVVVAGERIAPVDWETAAVGPGLLDLAALITGWAPADQRAIASAYGAVDAHELTCCRLHLALQWIGWRGTWTPPDRHANDWEREALEAASELGL